LSSNRPAGNGLSLFKPASFEQRCGIVNQRRISGL
jgi:hypothetical protein